MKKYESPEFELIRIKFTEELLVHTASVETEIPDVGDDWD